MPNFSPQSPAQSLPRGLRPSESKAGVGAAAGDVGLEPTRDPVTRGPVPPGPGQVSRSPLPLSRTRGSRPSFEGTLGGQGGSNSGGPGGRGVQAHPPPAPALRAKEFRATPPRKRPKVCRAAGGVRGRPLGWGGGFGRQKDVKL